MIQYNKESPLQWDREPYANYWAGILSIFCGVFLAMSTKIGTGAIDLNRLSILAAMFFISVWRDSSATIFRSLPLTLYAWYHLPTVLNELWIAIGAGNAIKSFVFAIELFLTILVCREIILLSKHEYPWEWHVVKEGVALLMLLHFLLLTDFLSLRRQASLAQVLSLTMKEYAILMFFMANLLLLLPKGYRFNPKMFRYAHSSCFWAVLISLLVVELEDVDIPVEFYIPFLLATATVVFVIIWLASLILSDLNAKNSVLYHRSSPAFNRLNHRATQLITDYREIYLANRLVYRQYEYTRIVAIQLELEAIAAEKEHLSLDRSGSKLNKALFYSLAHREDQLKDELSKKYEIYIDGNRTLFSCGSPAARQIPIDR